MPNPHLKQDGYVLIQPGIIAVLHYITTMLLVRLGPGELLLHCEPDL